MISTLNSFNNVRQIVEDSNVRLIDYLIRNINSIGMEKISKNYTECSKNEKHEFFRISKGRSQDLYWEWSKSLSFYKRSAVEITEVFQSRRLISYDYLLTREIFISTVSIAVISEWHLPSSCCSDSDKRKGEYFWEIDRYT